jgi:hypothetical protein
MSKKRKNNHYRLIFICLALSIFSWFAVKISKNYTQTYQFHVEFINLPEGKFLTNQSDTIVAVSVNAKGVYLLEFEFGGKAVSIDYSLIATAETQQNNSTIIEKKQLESYLVDKLDFPENTTVIDPLLITLTLDSLPDK